MKGHHHPIVAQTGKWSDGDTNATREITVTDDIELEAIFEVIAYTITIESANSKRLTMLLVQIIYLILELWQDIIKRECASNWRTLFSLAVCV